MTENENKQPAGSRRMKILQQSLAKKQAAFDQRLQNHFDDVRSANGQPLNDKRNGQATLNRWERQNDGLRTADKEIEKTLRAIEREQCRHPCVFKTDDRVRRNYPMAQIPEPLFRQRRRESTHHMG